MKKSRQDVMLVASIAGAVLFALITAVGPLHGQTAATGEGDKKPPPPEPKRPGAPGGTWAAKPDPDIEAWSATKAMATMADSATADVAAQDGAAGIKHDGKKNPAGIMQDTGKKPGGKKPGGEKKQDADKKLDEPK